MTISLSTLFCFSDLMPLAWAILLALLSASATAQNWAPAFIDNFRDATLGPHWSNPAGVVSLKNHSVCSTDHGERRL